MKKTELEAIMACLTDMSGSIADLSGTVSGMSTSFAAIAAKQAELEQSFMTRMDTLDAAFVERLAESLEDIRASIPAQFDAEPLDTNLAVMGQRLTAFEERMASIVELNTEQFGIVGELGQSVSAHTLSIQSIRGTLGELDTNQSSQVRVLRDEMQAVVEKVSATQNSVQIIGNNLGELTTQVVSTSESMRTLQDSTAGVAQSWTSSLHNLDKRLTDLDSAATEEVRVLKARASELDACLSETNKELDGLSAELAKLGTNAPAIAELALTVTNLETRVGEVAVDMERRETILSGELVNLDDKYANLSKEFKVRADQHSEALEGMDVRMQGFTGVLLPELAAGMAKNTEDAARIVGLLENLGTASEALAASLKTLDQSSTEMFAKSDSEYNTVNLRLNILMGQVDSIDRVVGELTSVVPEYEERITEVRNSADGLSRTVQSLQDTLQENLEGYAAKHATDYGMLDSRISSVVEQFEEFSRTTGELTAKVSAGVGTVLDADQVQTLRADLMETLFASVRSCMPQVAFRQYVDEGDGTLVVSMDAPGEDGKPVTYENKFKLDIGMRYRSVYKKDETYTAGDSVTHDGSMWLCRGGQTGAPGKDYTGWQLIVKRGGNGKDGYSPTAYAAHKDGNVYHSGDFLRVHNRLWQCNEASTETTPGATQMNSSASWTLIGGVQ